jgi:hypothetical protein
VGSWNMEPLEQAPADSGGWVLACSAPSDGREVGRSNPAQAYPDPSSPSRTCQTPAASLGSWNTQRKNKLTKIYKTHCNVDIHVSCACI